MNEADLFHARWTESAIAVADLYDHLAQLIRTSSSVQDLTDQYLASKRAGAVAFQNLLRSRIPDHDTEWLTVRNTIAYEMTRRYSDDLPEWALRVPYGSSLHRELFSLLLERVGDSVAADYLRIITGDAVHAERRVRELRELGLSVSPTSAAGTDSYRLASDAVDLRFVPRIVANTIKSRKLPKDVEARLLDVMSSAPGGASPPSI